MPAPAPDPGRPLAVALAACGAALAAGAVVAAGHALDFPPLYPMLLGAGVCTFLRMMAIHRDWRAPVARWGGGGA